MIQRVQTVYLIIVIALLCGLISGFTSASAKDFEINLAHNFLSKDAPLCHQFSTIIFILKIFAFCIIGVNGVAIFFYKRRKTQMMLCLMNFWFLIIMVLLGIYLLYHFGIIGVYNINYLAAIFLPALGSILESLALRGIKRDDELVKSYDRLR